MKLITTGGVPAPDGDPVIFLGPWCENQDLAAPGSRQFDGYASPDKRADLERKSREISESIFPDLVSALNGLHGVDAPPEFWSRTIKLWLEIFVDVVYLRWDCISDAALSTQFSSALRAPTRSAQLTPKTRLEIQRLINSHEWNHYIFGEILNFLDIPQEDSGSGTFADPSEHLRSSHFNPKQALVKRAASWLSNLVVSRTKYVITQTYLPRKVENKLAIRLRTLPFKWKDVVINEVALDRARRSSIQIQTTELRNAEQFIRSIIPQHIPMLYIEHYQAVTSGFTKKSLPGHPVAIFTSNLHMASEQFLLWMSQKALAGTRIIIGQHGGVHGMSKYESQEFRHEMRIADSYLSWGWTSPTNASVVPTFALINASINEFRTAPFNFYFSLLVVVDSTYRYPSPSRGVNGPLIQYFDNCCVLVEQLSDPVLSTTCVRLYHEHEYFDQNQMSIWQSKFPNLNIDSGHSPMKELREQARIVLCTSIGTTYIETIHRNIPTVLFLDPQSSPLKIEHSAIYDQLERAGVLHYSPHSAAAHINDVWGKVDEWWQSKSVRDAIAAFANTFSRTEKDPIPFLQSAISGNPHLQRSEQ